MPDTDVRPEDLLVYAPLGAALFVRDKAPEVVGELANRGRAKVEQTRIAMNNVLGLARQMGEVRVKLAQQEGRKRTEEVAKAAEDGIKTLQGISKLLGPQGLGAPRAGVRRPVESVNGSGAAGPAATTTTAPGVAPADEVALVDEPLTVPVQPVETVETVPADAGLAIPDYDSLSATQVASRLSGLDADELRAVREYEASHRNRKTIVGKIDTLLAD